MERWFGSRWFGPGAPFGSPGPTIEHPTFGKLVLCQGAKGPYWLHESYTDDEVCISVDTCGVQPPTQQQEAFFSAIINDLDGAFAKMNALVAPEYENFLGRPLPSQWREAFRLASVGVPLDGDGNRDWDITFECITENKGFLFTCYFEYGAPTGLTVDT